jgi:hypothetical protein
MSLQDVAVWKLQPQDVVLDLFESEVSNYYYIHTYICLMHSYALIRVTPLSLYCLLQIEIMRKLQHPNVVRFVGAITSLARVSS